MLKELTKNIHVENLLGLVKLENGAHVASRIIITKELFFNETTGFGSFLCHFEDSEDKLTMSGVFLDRPEHFRTYEVLGEKSTYQNRPQLKSHSCELSIPKTKLSNLTFLLSVPEFARCSAVLIDAYGSSTVEKVLYEPFDAILANEKLKLHQQREPELFETIKKNRYILVDMFEKSKTLNRLLGLNLSKSSARKIYNLFGQNSYETLRQNPYIILKYYEDLGYGLSFCDNIAIKFGFKPDSKLRHEYGVIDALNVAGQNGHIYLPRNEFTDLLKGELTVNIPNEKMHALARQHAIHDDASRFDFEYFNTTFLVSIGELRQLMDDRANFVNDAHEKSIALYIPNDTDVESALTAAIANELVVENKGRIYSKNLYEKELGLYHNILSQLTYYGTSAQKKPAALRFSQDEIKSTVQDFTLETMQEQACIDFLKSEGGVFILTGNAGSGKTYTIKSLIRAYMSLYKKSQASILLAAPTGRAAKRIQESTGFNASTIHRALKMSPETGWQFNRDNPLPQRLVIVDEFSMVDTEVAFRLFDAIRPGTKIILVGDTKQLASVGPGNVMQDMMDSHLIPVVELNVIKRQQEKSDIIENAVRVIQKQPLYEGGKNKDSFVLYRNYNEQILNTILASFNKIQSNLKTDTEQIQVLIPQRKSRIGTYNVNHILQRELNPNPDSTIIANQFNLYNSVLRKYEEMTTYYRVGDKVINIKNNYSAQWHVKDNFGGYTPDEDSTIVTNGEIGVIVEIVKPQKGSRAKFTNRIIVKMDDKFIFYDDDFESLELAYAITVHKSQGSQWKACIYVVSGTHKRMLTNNLMYTAMTRPSEFLTVIGEESAINFGIKNDIIDKRYSTLCEYLRKA